MRFKSLIAFIKRRWKILFPACLFLTWYIWGILPNPLFKKPYSTLLLDQNNSILGAALASDGQWRFPIIEKVPSRFEQSIIYFEDEYFYRHPGVNPVSTCRALWQMITTRKVKSGGSTLTMQTVRLARTNPKRSLLEKGIEMIAAARLEISYSKKEILQYYCSHAPFGGNVVGLEAAAWRYYGREPEKLSWAESALLAVLPNAPALLYPGKNSPILLRKRNRLLLKLKENGVIDALTYKLAIIEPLPGKPIPLPKAAPHLLQRCIAEGKSGQRIQTSINAVMQSRAQSILQRYHGLLKENGVNNACLLIADVNTGKTLAYIGNTSPEETEHGGQVDIITSQRSYGSLLKPALYALSQDEGLIAPHMLLPDHPINIDGYAPRNFLGTYEGAVPAHKALARSLNIPYVKLLQQFGTDKFLYKLNRMGIVSLNKSASHYGLSLILGGGESTMWELSSMYASMARSYNNRNQWLGKYNKSDYHPLTYTQSNPKLKNQLQRVPIISYGALYQTFEALLDVQRPGMEANWADFCSARKIAWKTGTSFGFRDAWAIGFDSRYVVAVWMGNADGEGRPGLTGVSSAAPMMFEVFNTLPNNTWFTKPQEALEACMVCSKSGQRLSAFCERADSACMTRGALKSPMCSYHKPVQLTMDGKNRVNSDCEAIAHMQTVSWFVLPGMMEYYYRRNNPNYRILPAFRSDCPAAAEQRSMEFIYPQQNASLFVPREIDGQKGRVILELAHRRVQSKVYWHLDGEYLGTTTNFHQMPVAPLPGKHSLSVVDEKGENLRIFFEILGK